MCGIIGYIGKEKSPLFLVNRLERLEYRGYDSCGMAFLNPKTHAIEVRKDRGKIQQLKELVQNEKKHISVGIAHTRWATHGMPTKPNAHPHLDCTGTVAIVHNGIIENYQEIKEELTRKKHRFVSQTDTEVIVHLLEEFYLKQNWPLEKAVMETARTLKGSFAVVVLIEGKKVLVGVRKNSPLVVGLAHDGAFFASDVVALAGTVQKVIYLEEETITKLSPEGLEITNFCGQKVNPRVLPLHMKAEEAAKGKFKHFMHKEIYEQPEVLERLIGLYVKHQEIHFKDVHVPEGFLRRLKNIYIVGCGTAYHAGLGGKYLLERFTDVKVEIDVSSEFRYRKLNLTKEDLVIAISQSGETADTLAAVKMCTKSGAKVISICNTLASSLSRESDGLIHTQCGPEISVASTKAYTAQLCCMLLFALYMSSLKKTLTPTQLQVLLEDVKKVPEYQRQIFAQEKDIRQVAKRFSRFGCFLYLGRNLQFPTALEGALKLKEISYIPAEGYAAGEMKHGPIALIDEYRAVVCIAPKDSLYEKMISNIEEIRARKGKILAVTDEANGLISELADSVIVVPQAREELYPLFIPVVLQLLAYYVAIKLHHDIDQPRNLAKSVTVE